MPASVVKTPADEKKWDKAKELAADSGEKENYAYIMGIYKNMKSEQVIKKYTKIFEKESPMSKPWYPTKHVFDLRLKVYCDPDSDRLGKLTTKLVKMGWADPNSTDELEAQRYTLDFHSGQENFFLLVCPRMTLQQKDIFLDYLKARKIRFQKLGWN